MTEALMAGLVALGAASTLLMGALIAWFVKVPAGVVAGVMAFGAGVLISTLSYELVQEANEDGGLVATISGFLVGAVIYVSADALLARYGARHRKQSVALAAQSSGGSSAANAAASASGLAIAVGALLDGIPESIVLGLSPAGGAAVSIPILVAVAISNIPEGLSSSAGMKESGRSARYVFGVWGGIVVLSGFAAFLGNLVLTDASSQSIAFVTTIAAGGIMAMLANTMIPEAFLKDRSLTGLYAAAGFAAAFALHSVS